MRAFKKYFKKREIVINEILEKVKGKYTTGTFHKLHVEIKKLDAIFELINYCSKEFKRNKTFSPFNKIFNHTGKVREIQLEEALLNRYLSKKLLTNYRNSLKKILQKEKKVFFLTVDKYFSVILKEKFAEIEDCISEVDRKKAYKFIKNKKKNIRKTLNQVPLDNRQLHELRKQFKKINYIRMSLGLLKQKSSISKVNRFLSLIGKWHDSQVIIRHQNKLIDAGEIKKSEIKQLMKINMKILSDSESLIQKINRFNPASEFFHDK